MTRYSWLVGTRKNLKVSTLFYLSIFQEGKPNADANSRHFNIEPEKDKNQSPSSSSNTPSPTSSNTSSSSSTSSQPANSNNPNPTDTSTAGSRENSQGSSRNNNNEGLSTDVKIGVAASVPVAVILSIGLIAFLLKRRRDKKRQGNVPIALAATPIQDPHKYYDNRPGSYHFYGSSMSEAPSHAYDDPVELGAESPARASPAAAPVRYEM